jgi:hypothetical protein
MPEVRAGTVLYKLTEAELKSLVEATDQYLIQKALEKKVGASPDDLVVRDILPGTDLNNMSGEVWNQHLSAYLWTMNYSGKNPDTKIFGIFGYKNKSANPHTVAIRFKVGAGGAKIKDIWHVEQAQTEENTAVYSKNTIIYMDDETFVIEFYGDANTTDERGILLGRVVEPKGEIISPD